MESDWRWNVWDIGMTGAGYYFAGKLRTPIPVEFPPGVRIDYILYKYPNPSAPYMGIATDTAAYTNAPGLFFWLSSYPDTGFPGPFDVFPD